MKDAGINFVRIAESTWGIVEPSDGIYNFSHIDRVLDAMHNILTNTLQENKIWNVDQELHFPFITKKVTNSLGNIVHYYFNYSNKSTSFIYKHEVGTELLDGKKVPKNSLVEMEPWGVKIIEER